jgi:non-heme Fe2+,alpha-ketoglutarate-dependent halogenase
VIDLEQPLTEQELRQFDGQGFIGPFTLCSPSEMRDRLRRLRGQLYDRTHAVYAEKSGGNIANYDRHLDVALLMEHIKDPAIVRRVRSVLGDDLLCWRSEFFVKYPGDEGTDWHQSRSLAIGSGRSPLHPTRPHAPYEDVFMTLNVWTALTDSTISNGCLQLIPGSHKEIHYDEYKSLSWRQDRINNLIKNGTKKGLFGYDSREAQIDSEWTPPESKAVNIQMTAGQFVLFWEATMHGSLPNVSTNDTRMAFAARYLPTSVRIYPDMPVLEEYGGRVSLGKWRAVLVSGKDDFGHNRLLV